MPWAVRNSVGIWAFAVATAWVPLVPSAATLGRWSAVGLGAAFFLWHATVRPTPGHWLGAALLAWMAAGLLWTVSGFDTAGELVQWAMVAGAFCVGAELASLDEFWIGCGLGVTASAMVGLLQLAGLDPVTSIFFLPTGLFLSKNMAADAAVLALVGAAFTRWWLVPGPLALAWMVQSRTAAVALAAAGFAALWIARPRDRRRGLLVLGLLCAGGALAGLLRGDLGRYEDRLEIWAATARNLHLAGDGLGSFAVAATYYEYAHSEFLQYAFELGLGSALLWLILGWSLWRGPTRERAVLVAFSVICALWFPLHAPFPAFVAAVVAGHLCGERARARDDERARRMVGASGLFDGAPEFCGAVQAADHPRLRDLGRGRPDLFATPGRRDVVSLRPETSVGAGPVRCAL